MTKEAFEQELGTLLKMAFGLAKRMTGSTEEAEDLLQEATLSAYRGRANFQPGTHFKAWYFRILLNTHYRRNRKKQVVSVELEEVPDAFIYRQAMALGQVPDSDPAEALLGGLEQAQIVEALDSLPDDFRETCMLYFVSEMSYEEIAQALDIPVGTVRSRLFRGRKLLQKALWQLAQDRGWVAETEVVRS